MGLAASQARFLAITSRKMNCEFQSMQLAQQKLSVTRDLQKASQDYQNAITASELVWETEDGSVYDVTYDTMMKPSVLNEYDPYLLTDKQGRVVLNKAMFEAAKNAGVIDAKGNPTGNYTCGSSTSTKDGSRNAFIYQLGAKNQIASTVGSAILSSNNYTSSGVGGEILDKISCHILSTATFIDYLKETPAANFLNSWNANKNIDGEQTTIKNATNLDGGEYVIMNGTSVVSAEALQNLTWGDILEGNYSISQKLAESKDSTNVNKVNDGTTTTAFNNLQKALDSVFFCAKDADGNSISVFPSDTDSTNGKEWIDIALSAYYATNNQTGKGSVSSVSNGVTKGASDVKNTTNAIVYQVGTEWTATMSLTNFIKTYLTLYAIGIEGYGNGLNVDKKSASESTFVTDDMNYNWVVNNDNAVTEQDALNEDFYNMLYNNICMYGACTDEVMQEQVMDKEYLSYAIKNGQIFVSSLHDDGYFYQGHYTQNGHIGEVSDQDAIARAELEYEVTKSKLNYKEETIELKMKNLDTEISALTTEFDTVKNLISKNIEKVFTMFSS